MKGCCRRFCCMIFCCKCNRSNPLKSLDEGTRLLPKNSKTKTILEKNELHCFGSVPDLLQGNIVDISAYTRTFVKKIVCGSNHCLILFNDNQLAGFGGNEEGQLGFDLKKDGSYINNLTVNKLTIPNINRYEIWDIAAGENFSLVLIGSNLRSILVRLGVQVEEKYRDNLGEINTISVIPLDYEKLHNISKVYAFGQRSMFITGNNDIYVGGTDFESNPLDKYKFVDHFEKQIRSVHMGSEHCLIFDYEGELYGLGDGTYGELGADKVSGLDKPLKINLPQLTSPIKKVSVGARHSLVLLENGELYAFGDNSEGQCAGYGSRYASPIKVELETRERIIDIYSGDTHNMLVLANGEMYTWGDTSSGKLGYSENKLIQNTPKLVQILKGKYPNYISLGFQMTVVSTFTYESSLCSMNKIF